MILYTMVSKYSRLIYFRRLFFIFMSLMGTCQVFGHASPNSLIIMEVAPKEVHLEVQLPIPELELAFGQSLSKHPEKVIDTWGEDIKKYLLQHIKVYVSPERPWNISLTQLGLKKGLYEDQITPYWEVVADIVAVPVGEEDIRDFYLAYDVIMHQVMNHVAFVSIKSDWKNGDLGDGYEEQEALTKAAVIAWDLRSNTIPPLHIKLEEGTYWKGFMAMVTLGMHHITEGTDHLMFLLVLLLPAPLVVTRKRWGSFKGMKSSLKSLLQIITAFTIGHSATLLFGALGWYHIAQNPVELLIAFSIAIAALHALTPVFAHKEVLIAGGFGLIHGMAFAATIAGMNLDTWTMVVSIFGFNIGIELMQLLIVACLIPWLLLMSKTPYYKWFRIPVAISTMIAAIAWGWERWNHQGNLITTQLDRLVTHYIFILVAVALLSIGMFLLYKKNAISEAL